MTGHAMESLVPQSVQVVLDLFHHELSEVAFPGVDGDRLEEARQRVVDQGEILAQAEAVVRGAREELQQAQDELLARAQRALAYARVFAEEDAALDQRLAAIELPRKPAGIVDPSAIQPKRRGRPPKVRNTATLFSEETVGPGFVELKVADGLRWEPAA